MWVSSTELTNIKAFQHVGPIAFSKNVNLLIGRNNTGKSIILRSLAILQGAPSIANYQPLLTSDDVRYGFQRGDIHLIMQDVQSNRHLSRSYPNTNELSITIPFEPGNQ